MKTFSNFKFHMYTDVLFGKGTEMEVANMIKKHGGTKGHVRIWRRQHQAQRPVR